MKADRDFSEDVEQIINSKTAQCGNQPDNSTAESDDLLTPARVADKLGVSKDWVRDHATRRTPHIPVVRLGGKRALLRFRPQDVEQFIADHLVSTPPSQSKSNGNGRV